MASRPSIQAPLEFIPPRFNRWVNWLSYATLPITLRLRLRPWLPAGIEQVNVHNTQTLVQLFHQFQANKIRLLIAFRHVEVEDPLCMGYMFSHTVPQVARQLDIPLRQPLHSHFMYDRGMSLWAGQWLKGFFADLGGVPVRRGRRLDLKAIKSARQLLVNGRFPLTIAPEGATNGHGEMLSPLEPGVAQMAFWGVQDLRQQQRLEDMIVLPVSVRYYYPCPNWERLEQLLQGLEVDCGLVNQTQGQGHTAAPASASPQFFSRNGDRSGVTQSSVTQSSVTRSSVTQSSVTQSSVTQSSVAQSSVAQSSEAQPSAALRNFYYQRLLRIGIQMLSITTQVYRQFYNAPLPEPLQLAEIMEQLDLNATGQNEAIAHHLTPLLDEILKISERYFGIPSTGNLPSRCRKLEEAGWNRIYRDDIADVRSLSPMEKGFGDRIAAESDLYMGHMRLVESLVAVSGHYVKDKPSFERFAETALILFDVMERIKGVAVPCRPRLGWRQSHITIGTPIAITERWDDYKQGRKAAKKAMDSLTEEVRAQLETLMQTDPSNVSSIGH
ncbi:MAG: 1-acyl-sn-glycerol-3-phosphate acyltransferase [Cyanothece sp. SIO2G6]|nr:1-acyl-sn-glycerol-3-phosphate acyltransferase [Cyanothece sp. SIO2G6]